MTPLYKTLSVLCAYMYTHAHKHTHIYIHTYIHTYTYQMYIYIFIYHIIYKILVSRLCDRGDAHSELHSVPSQWTCIPAVTKASKTSRSSLADPSFFTSNSEIITWHSRYESISSIFFKYILNITFTISFIIIYTIMSTLD